MTEPTWTLRLTKNGTKLATEDSKFRVTADERAMVLDWLRNGKLLAGSSPAPDDEVKALAKEGEARERAAWREKREKVGSSPAPTLTTDTAAIQRAWENYLDGRDDSPHVPFDLFRAGWRARPAQPDTQRRLERMAKLISEFAGHLDGCACITSLGPCTCGFEAAWDAIESVAAAARKEEPNAG